jgi:hypothetical protein
MMDGTAGNRIRPKTATVLRLTGQQSDWRKTSQNPGFSQWALFHAQKYQCSRSRISVKEDCSNTRTLPKILTWRDEWSAELRSEMMNSLREKSQYGLSRDF